MSLNKILFFIFFTTISLRIEPITIMIDPVGDAKNTGREIEDTFERSLTLQCAQLLKNNIEEKFENSNVIVTRSAGEIIQPFQNASYANKINVDLYLCISFYQQITIPSNVAIFYYQENLLDIEHKYNPLYFYHISQAHLKSVKQSKAFAEKMSSIFKEKKFSTQFLYLGTFGIPCMQLFGIQVPALYIEAGLAHKNDWKYLIEPIVQFLDQIL